MPATIFKGSIAFGLVSVPIRLIAATEEKSVTLHQVHKTDGGRVRYRKVCERDGQELQAADIERAYEASDGRVAFLSAEDMQHLPLPTRSTIEVTSFTDADQIDPTLLGRSYLVEADPKSPGKPYVLLRDALAESGRVGVVRVALRGREHLGMLRAAGEVLMLQLLMWPDEVRDASAVNIPEDTVRAQEKQMAGSLISEMTADFEPDQYEDHYREALLQLVEAKLEGAPLPEASEVGEGAQVLDLMAALKASVKDAAGGGRKAPARKAAPAGKKAAAGKKATAAKTSAAKSADKPAKKASAAKETSAKAEPKSAKSAKSAKKTAAKKKTAPSRPRRAG
ncbi:Ku protein [Mangrovactinospora gilvigrisea]|uniref:Non-homologous end joining protein Ku n=1 Tax=Mangrovactinospora gilvigrisea TaxID=1428644 RepID=A0A1J7C9M5_9ACTN|nr:Ku protein [Mangrovactinospora gilvigrisea]OIV38232.1 Ku protein [Mangrovactinospora gilvigrisea]